MDERSPSKFRAIWFGLSVAVVAASVAVVLSQRDSGVPPEATRAEAEIAFVFSGAEDLEFKRSASYFDIESTAQSSGRVYAGAHGVTARFSYFGPDTYPLEQAASGAPDVVATPVGSTGASGVLSLGGSAGVAITVSRASDTDHAVQIVQDLAAEVRAGVDLGFTKGGTPAASIGGLELVSSIERGESLGRYDQMTQIYQTPGGGELQILQAVLGDGPLSLDLVVLGLDTPIEFEQGNEFVWIAGGAGVPTSLYAESDGRLITIVGAPSKEFAFRILQSLKPVDRSEYRQIMSDAFALVTSSSSPQPFDEKFVIYRSAQNGTVVCRASAPPTVDSCVWPLSESPVVAAIPEGNRYAVIYCENHQPVETIEINGANAETTESPCGSLATSVVSGPDLTIDTVIDGLSSTSTFDLSGGI